MTKRRAKIMSGRLNTSLSNQLCRTSAWRDMTGLGRISITGFTKAAYDPDIDCIGNKTSRKIPIG
ncbi:hypothetical protein J6590_090129 [Homalodisca vitripennis]|nr:hypothetical protein J6590_090129 [Homalodisca vitripennis]